MLTHHQGKEPTVRIRHVVMALVAGWLMAASQVSAAGPEPAGKAAGKASEAPAPVVLTLEELGRGVPEYAKDKLPEWVEPFVGRKGLPAPWNETTVPLAPGVKGLDRWQANRFLVYRPETARFIYEEYTPLAVNYKKGTSPLIEKTAEECTRNCKTDTERAVAMLVQVFPDRIKHPTVVPKGPYVPPGRDASDDELLASGCAWCNEQARVFVRLCQACGMPARIIHLFYSDDKTGHTIAEFYADGRWAMADASYVCVFPGKDGRLMSAAQCHAKENLPLVAGVYRQRIGKIAAMSDEQLGGAKDAAAFRAGAARMAGHISGLKTFAVMNHPLPQ
jgi:hypothetical protein